MQRAATAARMGLLPLRPGRVAGPLHLSRVWRVLPIRRARVMTPLPGSAVLFGRRPDTAGPQIGARRSLRPGRQVSQADRHGGGGVNPFQCNRRLLPACAKRETCSEAGCFAPGGRPPPCRSTISANLYMVPLPSARHKCTRPPASSSPLLRLCTHCEIEAPDRLIPQRQELSLPISALRFLSAALVSHLGTHSARLKPSPVPSRHT